MSLTDDDLMTTDAAVARLEGIEGSGRLPDFGAQRIAFVPDSPPAPESLRIVCQTSY